MRLKSFSLQSLSARVLWLIVGFSLLGQLIVLMPGLGMVRHNWLARRVAQARIAATTIENAPSPLSTSLRDTLLKLSRTDAIILKNGHEIIQMPVEAAAGFTPDVDFEQEGLGLSILRADLSLLQTTAPYTRVFSHGASDGGLIEIIISEKLLGQYLRLYAAIAALLATALAFVTGILASSFLNRMLVRPLRIMTASIANFRRSPGYTGLGDLKRLSIRGDDQIAQAARELVIMQDELGAALWRNARLAALGTEVAKISHDLRNILTSALLVADRFQHHGDPMVNQAANTLIPAMERAVELVSRTVNFAQEGPPAITRSPVAVHAMVQEIAEALRGSNTTVVIKNLIPAGLLLSLDRGQIHRVLTNLLRNAVEAGATWITLKLEAENGLSQLVISDNGPGLPQKVIQNLFKPFNGSSRKGGAGLGLAIARDVVRAHGGDLWLRRTGPDGTVFVMSLSTSAPGEFDEDVPTPRSSAFPLP